MTIKLNKNDFKEQFQRLEYLKEHNDLNEEYKAIREQLVKENMYLVDWCLKNYFSNVEIPHEDAKMYGLEGLVIAINKYDYKKGYPFSSYAIRAIKHNIEKYLSEMALSGSVNYLPSSDSTLVQERPKTTLDYQPRYEMPMTLEDYEEIDSYEDETFPSFEENYVEIVDYHRLKEEVSSVIKELPQNEQDVLNFRFGLKDGVAKTREEIAKILGISIDVVRNLEQRALNHLKHPLHTRRLRPYYEAESHQRTDNKEVQINLKNDVYLYIIDLLKNHISLQSILDFLKMKYNIEWSMFSLTRAINLLNQLSIRINEGINSGKTIEEIIEDLNHSPLYPVVYGYKYYSWPSGFTKEFINSIINDYEIIDLDQLTLK